MTKLTSDKLSGSSRQKVLEEPRKKLESKAEQELIKWSIELGRKARKGRFKELKAKWLLLKKLDKMLEHSELTEEECLRLGDKIKEGMWKKYKAEGW